MDGADQVVDRPPPEFKEALEDPLIELSLTDSNELWLIQWPFHQNPNFYGQELSLKLHQDGLLGSLRDSSGKSYDVVSRNAQDPDATVFLSSSSESKIVGKISRCVSLVHYPEPSELVEEEIKRKQKHKYQRSSATSLTNSSRHVATPTQSIRPRSSHSGGSNATSMRSSKYRSSVSEVGEASELPKKRHIEETTRFMEQSTQDSGRGHSALTYSGSLEHSNERKSEKKKKPE